MNLSLENNLPVKYLFALLVLILFTACDMSYEFKTEEEKNFIGTWINPNARITISPKGLFSYNLEEPGKTVTMNTVIERIESDKVVVNLLVTESVFDVNSKPFLNSQGFWEMTIDGRKYTRFEY